MRPAGVRPKTALGDDLGGDAHTLDHGRKVGLFGVIVVQYVGLGGGVGGAKADSAATGRGEHAGADAKAVLAGQVVDQGGGRRGTGHPGQGDEGGCG